MSEKLKKLKPEEYIEKIENKFDKSSLYEAHLWTPLKLVTLMWWLAVYSKIIPKYFSKFCYIDLLASSGANVIKESGDVVLGSPLLSFLIPDTPFTDHIFVEQDGEKAETLKKILDHFKILDPSKFENYTILKGDCNEKINDISFDKHTHYFCFVDCEGLDVKWTTLSKLIEQKSDILLNFQRSSINRVLAAGIKKGYNHSLNEFCGGDWWEFCKDIDEFATEYIKKIIEHANAVRQDQKIFTDYIRVEGRSGSYYYDVILICKDGPYIRAWKDLKKKLSGLDDKDVYTALRICKGELTTLDDFIPDQSEGKSKLTTLNDFIPDQSD